MLVNRVKNFLMEENNGGEGQGGGGSSGSKEGILGDGGAGGGTGGTGTAGAAGGGAGGEGGNGDKGGGTGGDGGKGAGDPGSGNPPGGAGTPKVSIPENWQDILPDEIKNQANIGSYKTIEALAKGFIHAQKMVGADKIVIPKNAGDAEMREIFEKLGLPKEAEKYELKLAENSAMDPAFLAEFKTAAFQNGVMPKQAQNMLNWFEKRAAEQLGSSQVQTEAKFHRDVQSIKTEWGDAYNENSARAKAALKEFGATAEDVQYIKENFTSNGPVIRLLAKIGATLDEGKIRGEGGTGIPGHFTPNEAKSKIAEIRTNTKGPYYDASHGDHAATKAEVARLYKFAYPEKKK